MIDIPIALAVILIELVILECIWICVKWVYKEKCKKNRQLPKDIAEDNFNNNVENELSPPIARNKDFVRKHITSGDDVFFVLSITEYDHYNVSTYREDYGNSGYVLCMPDEYIRLSTPEEIEVFNQRMKVKYAKFEDIHTMD